MLIDHILEQVMLMASSGMVRFASSEFERANRTLVMALQ